MSISRASLVLASALLFACGRRAQPPAPPPASPADRPTAPSVASLEPPTPPGSAEPFLFATNDGVLLSWLEPVAGGKQTALRVARLREGNWSTPHTVTARDDLFVNWADFPSVVEAKDGTLYAHWLQKSGADTYSYDIRMSTSADGGQTWTNSFLLNRDGRKGEHGFVSLSPLDTGGVAAAWLDARRMKPPAKHGDEGSGDMALRYAVVNAKGELAGEIELDARTCECCTTGMAITPDGPLVAYRDRSSEEIRDVSFVRARRGAWTEPAFVHADGWKIEGCPVNGPQADALGALTAVAWFTAAEDTPRVYVSLASGAGPSFGKPIRVDDGHPVGRADVVVLDEGSALVTWIETAGSAAEVRARRVRLDGGVDPSFKVGDTASSRAAGFPRITRLGNDVYVGWTTAAEKEKSIRIARIRF